ncbi:MAG TPA: hypothetical protein VGE01_06255 [Fimbriimonas sp.]
MPAVATPVVSVFMDVEDPINLTADDAVLDIASLFTEVGVVGSFCVTGDKCRVLRQRGRTDVVEALKPHCLGLHTNGHSRHPTTMEMLAEASFADGRILAYREEVQGFEAFVDLFERPPVFWGGAGNTWSPEITDALNRLGIEAYSYALTSIPSGGVHRFNGSMALPQTLWASEDEWSVPEAAERAMERVLEGVATTELPWIGIFVGHPTRFRHARFWDEPFAAGRTPTVPELTPSVPKEVYRTALASLRRFLVRLIGRTTVVGVDHVLSMPWRLRRANPRELDHFRTATAANLRAAKAWPIHRPDLSVERIVAKTLAKAETLEIAEILPEAVPGD